MHIAVEQGLGLKCLYDGAGALADAETIVRAVEEAVQFTASDRSQLWPLQYPTESEWIGAIFMRSIKHFPA